MIRHRKTIASIILVLTCLTARSQARLTTHFEDGAIHVEFQRPDLRPVDTVSVTIVGDMMLHQSQIDNCFARYASTHPGADRNNPAHYDFTPCLQEVRDRLTDADICIANMEFTLAGAPYSGYPAFCSPDTFAPYVQDCGVDVFLTANNHILDKGDAGARRTLEIYDGMDGISHTGCFSDSLAMERLFPLIVECRGVKIALVNFTYGTNVNTGSPWPRVSRTDREAVGKAMIKAGDLADIVIALPHWGIEYKLAHSAAQEELADFLFRMGADAIIGAHPHVVQDTGYYEGFPDRKVPLAYSLGNFISNMSADNTQIGLMATLPLILMSDGSVKVGEPEYEFTWCSLPGGLTDCHVTIPVADYIGRVGEWKNPADYYRMIDTYNRIKLSSGIIK